MKNNVLGFVFTFLFHVCYGRSTQYHCLCGISSYFNPTGARSRSKNFDRFAEEAHNQGLRLFVVELFDQSSEIEKEFLFRYKGIKLDLSDIEHQLWQKETLLNSALEMTKDESCDFVAWIDADILFSQHFWINDICEGLKNFTVLQPFSSVKRLSKSESQQYKNVDEHINLPIWRERKHQHELNPGLVWAARKSLILQSKLYQYAIVGGGDTLFSAAVMKNYTTLVKGIDNIAAVSKSSYFQQHYLNWAKNVYEIFEGKAGVIKYPNAPEIVHLWHGESRNRQYGSRHSILRHGKYNPEIDVTITNATYGYLKWNNVDVLLMKGRKRLMLRRIKKFFDERLEDG